MQIAVWYRYQIAQPDFLSPATVMHRHSLFAPIEMMMVRLELCLKTLGGRVLALCFSYHICFSLNSVSKLICR